jgi:tRNA/tmRNA/rRNA uracil-C5-methylase (TrmA/RlmC/RlmD family)
MTHSSRRGDATGESRCPHRPPCPGCPRFGEPGIAPAARAALQALALAHGIAEVAEISGHDRGFRHRARLAIRAAPAAPGARTRGAPESTVGLFEAGTHRVVAIPRCRVHHPLINRVADVVARALAQTRVSAYSEDSHQGVARHLQVVVERRSQTAQVVLVANAAAPGPLRDCLEWIRSQLGAELHSLWFNANTSRSNSILGPRFHHWCGPDSVVEHFGAGPVHYPPGAFGQNNLDIAQRIIGYIGELVPSGARVTEFYAGVGAIGLSLIDQVADLRLNEIGAQSLRGLELGLGALDAGRRARVTVVPGAAGAAVQAAAGATVVIADPPRKGLDPQLTKYLAANPPERLIYVSCALQSLIADVSQLTGPGELRLVALRAFDLMPFTEHVETVAVFERVAGDASPVTPFG